ncbi:MAG: spore cortex biosynthesis protein YabQ [Clostridia bacterium]
MNNTLSQGYALLAFLYAGIVLGILYDVLRVFRLLCKSRFIAHLLDTLFGLLFGLVSMTVFYLVTGGALRVYGFFVMAAGASIQQWAFGWHICKMIVKRTRIHPFLS